MQHTWSNAHGTEEYIYKRVSIPSRMLTVHSYKLLHQICGIVDFLHIPPPPDVSNVADFAAFLWLSIVKVYAIDLQCRYIYIVIAVSLSEPHTSVTALHTCVCMYVCLSVCLFAAIYRKF